MTREEIVTALRICSSPKTTCNGCPLDGPDDGLIVGTACFDFVPARAADLIENQQREMEALRKANGHHDPVGLKGPLSECPICGGPCNWEPKTDTSTCIVCGYTLPKSGGTDGDEICRAALDTFGKSSQVQVAIEEMSELTKELCKNGRGQENTTHIAEEIADVQIMLRQMVMLFDCAGQVETFRWYKLERLAERIKEAKQ